jgi:hypothetical protein
VEKIINGPLHVIRNKEENGNVKWMERIFKFLVLLKRTFPRIVKDVSGFTRAIGSHFASECLQADFWVEECFRNVSNFCIFNYERGYLIGLREIFASALLRQDNSCLLSVSLPCCNMQEVLVGLFKNGLAFPLEVFLEYFVWSPEKVAKWNLERTKSFEFCDCVES